MDVPSGSDLSELEKDDEFTWHSFHVKGWEAQDFEGNAPMDTNNSTGQAVPFTWILLEIQSTMNLIANPNMLLNIKKVREKDAIRVHCNSRVKIVYRVGDLPGYGTVWRKLTVIANILSMSRAKNNFGSLSTARAEMF